MCTPTRRRLAFPTTSHTAPCPALYRWQKGKDVYWYTRDVERDGEDAANAELAAVKQREADLMMEVRRG